MNHAGTTLTRKGAVKLALRLLQMASGTSRVHLIVEETTGQVHLLGDKAVRDILEDE